MSLYIVDFGSLFWHILSVQTGTITQLSPEQFRTLAWLPNGAKLICEAAHLGTPRTDFSLAQVYTEQELLSLYAALTAKGCELRLFPQGITAKARAMAGINDKSDKGDLLAIAYYVQKFPNTPLKRPPTSFVTERRVEAGWTFKKENDGILNVARRFKYFRHDDYVALFVERNFDELASRLSNNAKEFVHLSDDYRSRKKGKSWNQDSTRKSRIYTLAALFLHPDGYARRRPDTGTLPGINWLKRYVLHFSPFHFKGGIARSNLKWHAFRNEAINALGTRKASSKGKVLSHYDFNDDQHEQFRQCRKEFMGAVTETMQTIRDMVQEKLENGELVLK
jgi:hypothetical protein